SPAFFNSAAVLLNTRAPVADRVNCLRLSLILMPPCSLTMGSARGDGRVRPCSVAVRPSRSNVAAALAAASFALSKQWIGPSAPSTRRHEISRARRWRPRSAGPSHLPTVDPAPNLAGRRRGRNWHSTPAKGFASAAPGRAECPWDRGKRAPMADRDSDLETLTGQLRRAMPIHLEDLAIGELRAGLIIVDEVKGFAAVGHGPLAPP